MITIIPSRQYSFTLINFIIGIIIAAVLSMLLVLGLRIFIPAPEYPRYDYAVKNPCLNLNNEPDCYQRQREESRVQQEAYEVKEKDYSGRIFIAANIMGLILLVVGIIIFSMGLGTNIGAGIILSGGFGITYGYTLGWAGAADGVKFVFGLVIAILVIAGGIMVNRMRVRTMTPPPHSMR
ncbi:MAG: DUF308 domain-containing protein [Patescibacteria group bacterium]